LDFLALGDIIASTTSTTTTTKSQYYDDLVASLPTLRGKCVAITGTTSGLGYWAAVATVKKGPACLIMLNRNSDRARQTQEAIAKVAGASVNVSTVDCDLSSFSSVRAAATSVNKISAKFGGLDVLTLNAGVMDMPDIRTVDGFDLSMQTDHLGHFLLTKLVMGSMHAAATARKEVRIVSQSSVARALGGSLLPVGGGPVNDAYYVKSPAGSLGGNSSSARQERYHQAKLANIVFAMALHSKFAALKGYENFKAVSAAPGWSRTNLNIPDIGNIPWLQKLLSMSAQDGTCSMLVAMFGPSVQSGDFYEPKRVLTGPPLQVIAAGVALSPQFPRWEIGIDDATICKSETQTKVWSASEKGLGERFIIDEPARSPARFFI
jgi:NAD(P)-dependent dehydrogenase (short-subunit alcohol dehydrogenase family)